MDTNMLETLTDAECVSMCMECVARGVAIPASVKERVQKLGIWKLIVGATHDYRYCQSGTD